MTRRTAIKALLIAPTALLIPTPALPPMKSNRSARWTHKPWRHIVWPVYWTLTHGDGRIETGVWNGRMSIRNGGAGWDFDEEGQ